MRLVLFKALDRQDKDGGTANTQCSEDYHIHMYTSVSVLCHYIICVISGQGEIFRESCIDLTNTKWENTVFVLQNSTESVILFLILCEKQSYA